jgi:hypothetical protein
MGDERFPTALAMVFPGALVVESSAASRSEHLDDYKRGNLPHQSTVLTRHDKWTRPPDSYRVGPFVRVPGVSELGGSYHVLPTTAEMDPPSTGDLRRDQDTRLISRVEEGRWTGAYRQPVVSLPRSSNRTCPFQASGFPTDFTNRLTEGAQDERPRSRSTRRCPNTTASGNRVEPREDTLWRCRRKCRTRS